MYTIKQFTSLLVILLAAQLGFGQTINTQGVLRDANGYALDDGTYSVTFNIYDAETGGTLQWDDTYDLGVTNGVFSVTLGGESNPINMLSDNQPYWIGIEVGTDGEMSPRLKLNTTPYEMNYLTGNQNTFPGTGNVGIGITSPTYKLQVAGQVYALHGLKVPSSTVVIENSSNDRAIMETGWIGDFGDYTAINSGYDWNTDNEPLSVIAGTKGVFITRAATVGTPYGETLMKIDKNGNVGIGATTPDTKLDVVTNTTTTDVNEIPVLTIGNLGLSSSGNRINGNRTGLAFKQYMNWNASSYDVAGAIVTGNNSSNNYHKPYMAFYTRYEDPPGTSVLYERMRINAYGRVGIGTTNPTERLHVMSRNDDKAIRVEVASGYSGAGAWWDIGPDHQTGDADLLFRSDEGGWAYLEPENGAFYNGSDRRLKKNIMPTTGVLNQVMRLKPSTYHMKSENATAKKRVGFIAQDVQEVFPDLSIVGEQDGMLGLSYADFSVLAIAAIQEQQEIIDRQQQDIDELKKRLARIEASLGNK